jgi:deferrochelatase/peroxidase EfeB
MPQEEERSHRIVRRGITYDEINRKGDLSFHPERGVGLLFLCFQSSIENQFEFIQNKWANNNDFPMPFTGIDPLIGQGENRKDANGGDGEQKWSTIQRTTCSQSLEGFVKMKGGEYFFAPSLTFIKSLSN